jgi:hypothetical protein
VSIRRIVPNPRTLRGKLGIAAFLTTFIVLGSSTASFAYWQSSQTVTSTVSAANLTLATSNFTSVGYTFGNDTLVTTGSVTATNNTVTNSTQAANVSLTFGPNAAATLAGLVTVQLWTTTNPTNCTAAATAPSGAVSALWSANTVVTTTLAPGASASYCVRSSIASRDSVAFSGGSSTFSPKISGTITLGNFSGTAVATTTQSTQRIFPSYSIDTTHWNFLRPNVDNATYDYCLDVSGAATTSGTITIAYSCKSSGVSNQQWKFTASGVAGYYTIQPRHATALRLDNSSATASGAGVSVVTASTAATATNQQWQLQSISTGLYQMVNASSGMCLTTPSGSGINLGQVTQAPCDGTVFQQFRLSQAIENSSCTATSSAWNFSWTSISTGPYHVQVQGTSTDLAVTAATAAGVSIPTTGYATNTTTNVNFIDGIGTLVGTGSLLRGSGTSYSCSVSELQ